MGLTIVETVELSIYQYNEVSQIWFNQWNVISLVDVGVPLNWRGLSPLFMRGLFPLK